MARWILWTAWNLALAAVPVLLARPVARRLAPAGGPAARRRAVTVALAALWLLWLPNAPYLLTEIRHFVLDAPWRALAARAPGDDAALRWTAAWGGAFVLYGAAGAVAFVAAVRPVEAALVARGARRWALRALLWPTVAMGVWLGLVPRFNSWDAFSDPLGVLGAAWYAVTHAATAAMVLGFSAVLAVLHTVLDAAADGWALRRAVRPPAPASPASR